MKLWINLVGGALAIFLFIIFYNLSIGGKVIEAWITGIILVLLIVGILLINTKLNK